MDRNLRLCDVCGQLDDHPRHITNVAEGGRPSQEFLAAVPEGTPVAAIMEVLEPTTVCRHLDCCAERGCPDGTCPARLAQAEGRRGVALIRFFTTGT